MGKLLKIDVPTITKPRLYYVISGTPNPVKLHVLNYCLLVFRVSFVEKDYKIKDISNPQIFADPQYEPGISAVAFRMLFASFRDLSTRSSNTHHSACLYMSPQHNQTFQQQQ